METRTYNTQEVRAIVNNAVQQTIERVGVDAGFVSYKKAVEDYGVLFKELYKAGKILPIHKGRGKTGRITFLRSHITEAIMAETIAAQDSLRLLSTFKTQ